MKHSPFVLDLSAFFKWWQNIRLDCIFLPQVTRFGHRDLTQQSLSVEFSLRCHQGKEITIILSSSGFEGLEIYSQGVWTAIESREMQEPTNTYSDIKGAAKMLKNILTFSFLPKTINFSLFEFTFVADLRQTFATCWSNFKNCSEPNRTNETRIHPYSTNTIS